jgi:hypothetical protein
MIEPLADPKLTIVAPDVHVHHGLQSEAARRMISACVWSSSGAASLG